MSLSQKDLSAIQKAGQAAHHASEVIGLTVRTQGESLVGKLSRQPFGSESDQVIERFKSLSSLSQGLIAVEAQLQKLYVLANELASPAGDVIVLPAGNKRRTLSNAAAVDVVAKPAKVAKKVQKVKRAGRKSAAPGSLTANDSKLLAYLHSVLKAEAATSLTGGAMAAGAKLPLGSVGISLKRIIAFGAVKSVGRGTYQLNSSPVTAVAEPEKAVTLVVKNAKVKSSAGKKVNAKSVGRYTAALKKGKLSGPTQAKPAGDVAEAPL